MQGYLDLAACRNLPRAPTAALDAEGAIDAVLRGLVAQGVAHEHRGGREPIFGIAPDAHLAVAYYRSTIALRSLLEFDFFFREREAFLADLGAETSRLAPDWRERLDEGPAGVLRRLHMVHEVAVRRVEAALAVAPGDDPQR